MLAGALTFGTIINLQSFVVRTRIACLHEDFDPLTVPRILQSAKVFEQVNRRHNLLIRDLGSFTSSPKHSGGIRPLAVTNTLCPRGHYRSRTKNTQSRAELHFQGLNSSRCENPLRESGERAASMKFFIHCWVSAPRTSRRLWPKNDIEPIANLFETPPKVLPARINVRFRSVCPVYPNGPL